MTDELRSTRSFDPSTPSEVYDELNGLWFEWKPDKYEQLYRECSNLHDEQRHVMEWDGLLVAECRLAILSSDRPAKAGRRPRLTRNPEMESAYQRGAAAG
jgi:hypothetical protein